MQSEHFNYMEENKSEMNYEQRNENKRESEMKDRGSEKRDDKNEAKNYNSSKSLKVIFKYLDSFRQGCESRRQMV